MSLINTYTYTKYASWLSTIKRYHVTCAQYRRRTFKIYSQLAEPILTTNCNTDMMFLPEVHVDDWQNKLSFLNVPMSSLNQNRKPLEIRNSFANKPEKQVPGSVIISMLVRLNLQHFVLSFVYLIWCVVFVKTTLLQIPGIQIRNLIHRSDVDISIYPTNFISVYKHSMSKLKWYHCMLYPVIYLSLTEYQRSWCFVILTYSRYTPSTKIGQLHTFW